MNNPVIKDAVDFENRFFASDKMKRQYELSEKHRHDYISSIDYAHMQGRAEGENETRRSNIINGLKSGIDVNIIAKITKADINEINRIKQELHL